MMGNNKLSANLARFLYHILCDIERNKDPVYFTFASSDQETGIIETQLEFKGSLLLNKGINVFYG